MMRWTLLVICGLVVTLSSLWLGVALQLPVPWLIALGLAQTGIMWWGMPWSIGIGLLMFMAGGAVEPWVLGLGVIGLMVQGWLPRIVFQRRKIAYDICRESGLSAFLVAGVLLNSLLSAALMTPVWSALQTTQDVLFSFALLWLVHSMVGLGIVLPLLRFGTHFLPVHGIWSSQAARQRSILRPSITKTDLFLLVFMELLILDLSTLIHSVLVVPFPLTNVLFLLPIVVLMTLHGFDGALLAAAASLIVGVAVVMYVEQIDPHLPTIDERISFVTIVFEMGVYYLISIVVGLLIDAQRSERRRLTTLLNLNHGFSQTAHGAAALEQLAQAISMALHRADCSIFRYDAEASRLVPLVAYPAQVPALFKQPLALQKFPMLMQPLQSKTASVLHSTRLESIDQSVFWLQTGYVTALLVPLPGIEQPLGLVGVFDARPERIFQPEEVQLVEVMCAHAATALDQQQLIARLKTQTTQLNAVAQITTVLNESLDVHEVCQRIIEQIARIVPHDWAAVLLHDADTEIMQVMMTTTWQPQPMAAETWFAPYIECPTHLCERTHPQRIVLAAAEEAWLEPIHAAGFEIVLEVPLIRDQQCLGLLVLASADTHAFMGLDDHMLLLLARPMALAIANASLYEQLHQAYMAQQQAQDVILQTERFRALGELASGIAHDFNNLLTSIMGHTQLLLLESAAPPEEIQALFTIEQAARDGHQMIKHMQQFVGARTDSIEYLNIGQIVQDVIALTRPRWQRKAHQPIEVMLDLQPVPLFLGSGYELRQVVTNLVINAVDAMPDGGTLTVNVWTADAAVVLQIQDTGIGMDAATQAAMWNPFFSTKGEHGTGLGMTMVHRVVVQHYAGQIDVESTPGIGSVFTLYLPYGEQDDPQRLPQTVAVQQRTMCGRVLVLEPDERVCLALERLLQSWGHSVTSVATGLDALPLLHAHTYDVLIVDAMLTDMNIWVLLEQAHSLAPHLRVMLLSGWVQHIEYDHGYAFVDVVVPKPFELHHLQATLAKLLAVQGMS